MMGSPSSAHADVLRRGARGAAALGIRQLLVQLLHVGAAVVLARVLTAAEFGVYGITVFLMNFLVVFGDAGLAAGLVREPDEPCELDYRAVFTFQQLLVTVVAATAILLVALFGRGIGPGGSVSVLLIAACVALVLASFQTTPAARLERHLGFDKLAVIEIAQAMAFDGVAVACALGGLGAHSMAVALVTRAAVGALMVRLVAPWPVAWAWDWSRVRRRLRFGLSFQGAALVGLVRDSLVPVFVGATLGSAAVGGIFFATMLATYPLIVVYMLQRLLMPLFARLQDRPVELARAVESSLFAVAAFVIPIQATVWALQQPITRIVFGAQWVASLDVYRWLWLAAVLEPPLVVALALLNALGRSQRTFRLVATTTAVTWIAGVPLLHYAGPVGFGIASALLLAIKWPLLREADAAAGTRSISVVAPVWAAALGGAALTTLAASRWEPAGFASLAVVVAASLLVDGVGVGLLAPARCRALLDWWRVARASADAPLPEPLH